MEHILFLDFDGVLNSVAYEELNIKVDNFSNCYGLEIDPYAIKLLNLCLRKCKDIKIVISSSWRTEYTINEIGDILFSKGFRYIDRIVGVTPKTFKTRGDDIHAYCIENNVSNYCILDDSDDILSHQRSRFVQTHAANGLTFLDVLKILDIIDKNNVYLQNYKYLLD